jgi:hypothetical protein
MIAWLLFAILNWQEIDLTCNQTMPTTFHLHMWTVIYMETVGGLGLVMCFTRWCTMGGDARTMKNGIHLLVLLQQEYTSVLLPLTTKNCRWLCWDNHKSHALMLHCNWLSLHITPLTVYRSRENFKLIAQESCALVIHKKLSWSCG